MEAGRRFMATHGALMKISIVGNCQHQVLVELIQAMVPDADVQGAWIHLPHDCSGSDLIFLSTDDQYKFDDSEAPISTGKVLRYPNFVYPGFHPDIIYAHVGADKLLQSPLSDYNSALVVYGWMKELSLKETLDLFCEAVFERLGYFDFRRRGDEYIITEGVKASMDMAPLLAKWTKAGCFAHSFNHPKLFVMGDIARALLSKAGLLAAVPDAERYLYDSLLAGAVWPVYPEIAERFEIDGDYNFKKPFHLCQTGRSVEILGLEAFVEQSFAMYATIPRDQLRPTRLWDTGSKYENIELITKKRKNRKDNPYSSLPEFCYWRNADFSNSDEMDLVTNQKFKIAINQKIATAGSCFAQHLAKTLIFMKFNYFFSELPPADMLGEVAAQSGYGLFSARFGNIYSVRQLLQLFQRAYNDFVPVDEAWTRADGRLIDPFRPQVTPEGYESLEALRTDRVNHFDAVRRMFEEADLFIFTAGLTEAWANKQDGAIFPVAPGVLNSEIDLSQYCFVNFRVSEIEKDLHDFIELVRRVNPNIKLLFTVSPVPLVATYESRHVIVSTTYSKSALRAAIGEVSDEYDFVDYFPSYEIITHWYNKGRYFEDDFRTVSPEGVAHVMRLFASHYLLNVTGPSQAEQQDEAIMTELALVSKIICDEELLDMADPGVKRNGDKRSVFALLRQVFLG
jgi:hypothetical protein